MSHKLLLDHNGVEYTVAHFNNHDGEFVLDHHMPDRVVKTILDKNHEDRSAGPNRSAHGRHVARVPVLWREHWRKEWKKHHSDKFTWSTYLVMQLNKSENKHLLTGVKKI